MQPTSTTRGRHALGWVLGAGLAFVVVVVMALQLVRRRADERWVNVVMAWDPEILTYVPSYAGPLVTPPVGRPELWDFDRPSTCGGNIFREWHQALWDGPEFSLVLRQERSFFGMSIGARLSRGWRVEDMPTGIVRVIHDIFAAVDVELVVEP